MGQEAGAAFRREVPDRAPEHGDESAVAFRQQVEVTLEVGGDRLDGQIRVVGRDLPRVRAHSLLAHVEGDETLEARQGIEEEPHVVRRACPELDERSSRDEGCDLSRAGMQDLLLAPRQVVLR